MAKSHSSRYLGWLSEPSSLSSGYPFKRADWLGPRSFQDTDLLHKAKPTYAVPSKRKTSPTYRSPRLIKATMCTCIWVEYCCECNKPDCPHKQPSHPHCHVQDNLFRIDHKAWRYCHAFTQLLNSEQLEHQDASSKDERTSTRQEDEASVIWPSKYFKNSTDPRHDGRLPLCKDIRYSAWRTEKNCDYCRDYWIGRSMDNAF